MARSLNGIPRVDLHHLGPVSVEVISPSMELLARLNMASDAVETLWNETNSTRRTPLVNNRIACMASWEKQPCRQQDDPDNSSRVRTSLYAGLECAHLNVVFLPYKFFNAHRLAPSLGLAIQPVAVSGLTLYGSPQEPKVLLAKRGPEVTQYPEHWECVPSGSLDEPLPDTSAREGATLIDPSRQILRELQEETKTVLPDLSSRNTLPDIHPFSLLFDRSCDTFDIGCLISFDWTPKSLLSHGNTALPNSEYSDFKLLTPSQAEAFLDAPERAVVPVSQSLMRAWMERHMDDTI
ncbi:MAG: hypothetical protein HQL50_08910 [Magnetococcales bacterium]|nr:hypothetical protein [Magnetococcales bacterium]